MILTLVCLNGETPHCITTAPTIFLREIRASQSTSVTNHKKSTYSFWNSRQSKASKLWKQYVAEEKEAVVQRTFVLQESRAKKAAAADKKRAKIQDMVEKLRPHHGPCLAPEDDNLLTIYAYARTNCKVWRQNCSIRSWYCSLILLFWVTETLQQLIRNLKLFFGAEAAAVVVPILLPQRRRRPASS